MLPATQKDKIKHAKKRQGTHNRKRAISLLLNKKMRGYRQSLADILFAMSATHDFLNMLRDLIRGYSAILLQ